ncbi:MAG: hypothetical protein PHO15_01705 [Eubacteriales bacterium]|nr:hypothetical protein [Eubacteriales bacterium]
MAKEQKAIHIILFWAFTILLLLPFALMPVLGASFDTSVEMRESAPSPELSLVKLADFPKLYEDYFSDNFAARNNFVNLNSFIRYAIFNTSSTDSIAAGKDGWLYYTDEENIDLLRSSGMYSEEELEAFFDNIVMMQNYYDSKGVEFIIVLIPSKSTVYPEYICGFDEQSNAYTPIDQVTDYIISNDPSIHIINVKDELLKYKDDIRLYFKTDTHWNYEGAYIGYRYIIEYLNDSMVIDSQPQNVLFEPNTKLMDLSKMLNIGGLYDMDEAYNISVLPSNHTEEYSDEGLEETINGIANPFEIHMYENNDADNLSVLIFHDSFIASWNMKGLLSAHFSKTAFIWTYYQSPQIIDLINPDVVILECTERYIREALMTFMPDLPDYRKGS